MNRVRCFLLMLLLFLLPWKMHAQRHFFYVRFDPGEGNATVVVNYIDSMSRSYPEYFYVTLSGGGEPQTADAQGWGELRQRILTQQNAPIVYADMEEKSLNLLFVKILDESVFPDSNYLKMYGRNDKAWCVSFILSEKMYERPEDYEIVPLEFVLVNQLKERGVKVEWLTYSDANTLRKRLQPAHTLFDKK
ncbi:MAG: hypothetical protein IJR53_09540 [Bacteroidales bacterium]|nr:hypothetical protein [Bacteroidales bacterium]